jgi:Tol biopolymer transport system component
VTEGDTNRRQQAGGSPPGAPTDLTGSSFGQYRIKGLLGAGGMGEVWRAEDTRLGRDVALKMLPEQVSENADRWARFNREAKVLASLNHPNIAVLYGLEHFKRSAPSDSPGPAAVGKGNTQPVRVLVMELIEGEGLDELIARGPLPFKDAMDIALQIAEGLRAAHECGIVHRDLKPANVRVRPDGTVKILDFGLATTLTDETADDSQSQYPTMTQRRTALGTILGTVAYMSPEQARGRQVDRRTDIWAFGCLLYEMLAAANAFRGETPSDVMASVLKDEPEWEKLPADLEPVAMHVLHRCLAKDPARRFHHIADVRIELEEAITGAIPRRVTRRRRPGAGWFLIAVVAAVAAATVAVASRIRPPEASMPTFRALSFHSGRVANARFAPDGTTVVFGASTRDRPLALLSTRTDSVESRPLELPPADILGISRNGQMAVLLDRHNEGSWVSVGTLATADLAGGAPRPIIERVNDGDMSDDGNRMAVVREVGQSQRLEYPLGDVLFETHGWISHVRIAPEGERVAFLHHPVYGDDRGLVAMVDTDGTFTELTEEMPDSLQGLAWSPDGASIWFSAFVFGKGGVLWSVRPGADRVERLSTPIAIRLQDIAPDGRAIIVAGDTRAEIAGLLAGQTSEQRFEGWNDDSIGGLDADGTMFAGNMQVATVDGEYAAFARSAAGSPPVRVGYGDVFGMSPDGTWVFTRKMTGDKGKLILLSTGPGEPRVIDLGSGVRIDDSSQAMLTCSLDGRRAAFSGFANGVGPRIFVMDLVDGRLKAVGPAGTKDAIISPDGSRVAALAPDGAVTIYPVAEGTPLVVSSVGHDEKPVQWTRDGSSLLLWNRAFPARIQKVDISDGSRSLALEIMPRDPAGVLYGQILLAADGRHYVYRYRRDSSALYLVDGLR